MYFDATEFAARLSTLRKAQGMTQEEMAEALNISLEHLSKMERGKRKPSIDLIIAMACYFHVSTDYLLIGKDHDKVDSRTKLLDVVTQLIKYALMTLANNTTRVKDMKQYMLAVLYNAPTTISSYYQNWVQHDMAKEKDV